MPIVTGVSHVNREIRLISHLSLKNLCPRIVDARCTSQDADTLARRIYERGERRTSVHGRDANGSAGANIGSGT